MEEISDEPTPFKLFSLAIKFPKILVRCTMDRYVYIYLWPHCFRTHPIIQHDAEVASAVKIMHSA